MTDFPAEQAKSELVAAGVSDSTATGIIAIAQKYRNQFESGKSDSETAKAAFKEFHTEVGSYMKTQSAADQTAYTAFVEKKKAEHQARKSAESSTW